MSDFDNAWKEAIDAFFEPFMAFFFGEAHREIDWALGFEMLDKELQQITPESEQCRRVADKLVKVWRTNGQDEWVLVHVEVQSQQETQFAERMFVYNYRLFDHYNRRVVYQEIYDFEKERKMPFLSTAERIGLEKGLAKGREEGLLAGIEVSLRIKFGQSGLALLSEIRQIDDVALLRTILDAVPQADSFDALRRLWVKA